MKSGLQLILDNNQETDRSFGGNFGAKIEVFKDAGFFGDTMKRKEEVMILHMKSSCHKDKDSAGEKLEEMRLMCQLSWIRAGKNLCCKKKKKPWEA